MLVTFCGRREAVFCWILFRGVIIAELIPSPCLIFPFEFRGFARVAAPRSTICRSCRDLIAPSRPDPLHLRRFL